MAFYLQYLASEVPRRPFAARAGFDHLQLVGRAPRALASRADLGTDEADDTIVRVF